MQKKYWNKLDNPLKELLYEEEIEDLYNTIDIIFSKEIKAHKLRMIKRLKNFLVIWFIANYHKSNLLLIPDDFPLVRKYKGKRFDKLRTFQDTFQKYYKNISNVRRS